MLRAGGLMLDVANVPGQFVSIGIAGVDELVRKLDKLEEKVSRRVIGRALRKGAKPIFAASRAMAPIGATGKLSRSLGIWSRTSKGAKRVYVGIKPKTFGPDEFFYPAPVELGHMRGVVHVPAQPFLRDAAHEQQDEALRIARAYLAQGLAREAIKK